MKIITCLSTAFAALLLCVSCIEREQEIPVPRIGFAEEFELDYESATILCTVSGNVTVSDLIIEYSETRDLSDAKTETFLKKGGVFSVTLTGLRNNTEYFYRYTVKNNISTLTDKEIRSFKTPKFINVESVSVEPANLVLQKGETNLLSAKVLPEDASNPAVSWSSGDETIVSVSSEGLVTALSPGSTTVTVTTADGGHTASCEIKVEQHAGSIGLDQESVELYETETCQLTATVLPEDAEDKEVEWSTSDEAVATVSGGIVTAVRAGEADITATTRDGGLTSTCHVTVRCHVESISLSEQNLTIYIGDSPVALTATVSPERASDKSLWWSSSASSIASVDNTGKVTAKSVGSATITVTSVDNPLVKATCKVRVEQHAGSISLDNESIELYESETFQLTATVLPVDAKDKTVEWSSSDEEVATVADGKVTAVRAGEADITAKAHDGGMTKTCHVTVKCHVESLSLSEKDLTMYVGDNTVTLVATVSPERATDKSIQWSSSDTSIASVDSDGKVTPKSSGTATITATSVDSPKVNATCKITVKQHAGSLKLSSESISLYEGEKSILEATVLPADAEDKTVEWSTSDEAVATVSDGLVTAVRAGEADITATTHDGGATRTCHVIVKCHVESVSLSEQNLTMYVGDNPVTLVATVSPERATDKSVVWTANNPSVATVDASGKVMATAVGTATIIVKTVDGGYSASCEITVLGALMINGYEYVDLGLPSGLKWATINVGASKPEEYGYYFAWGETDPKSDYGWLTYKWLRSFSTGDDSPIIKVSKYCTEDNKTVLDPEDDVASVKWKGGWRMPTDKEWIELRTKCIWTWTTKNGKTGLRITGPNGNSIFLPAAGYRFSSGLNDVGKTDNYWSSSLAWGNPVGAWAASGISDNTGFFGPAERKCGFSVRPVYGDPVHVTRVELNKSELTLDVGESATLTVTIIPSTASNKSVTCTSSDTAVATVNDTGKVTAIAEGSATITVTSVENADAKATCIVTVGSQVVPVTSVTVNPSSITLKEGDSYELVATVTPADATDPSVSWSSSNASVATVSATGVVTALSPGSTAITVTSVSNPAIHATCIVLVEKESVAPETVDLGLSVNWATFNVGATSPEDYGDYFAWGETQPKDIYDWSTYKWCNGSLESLTKYCTSDKASYWDGSGSPDDKIVLDSRDDAASANWGVSWRMPTDAEWSELRTKCTWTWTSNYNGTGIAGQLVTASNGNSLFLPAAGCRKDAKQSNVSTHGYYWSSSLYTDYPYGSWRILFNSDGVGRLGSTRFTGFSVRPVCGDPLFVTGIKLSKSALNLVIGKSFTLTATITPSTARNKSVTWSSSDSSVAFVDTYGKVTGVKAGMATITAETVDGGYTASCSVEVSEAPKPEAVDLGLSVKWATFNVGATKPEDYGDYFAWGETKPKSDYSWSTYKYANGASNKLTKYCPDDKMNYWDGSGVPDGLTNFIQTNYYDDAARANWGSPWRMPTRAEQDELRYNCSWLWTDNYNGTGVAGYIVTGKKAGYTNSSIFFPATGYLFNQDHYFDGSGGGCWSLSLNRDYTYSAYFLDFEDWVGLNYGSRCCGFSVRPVSGNPVLVTEVKLNKTKLTLDEEESFTLSATISPSYTTDQTVRWSSSNSSIATVNESGKVTAIAVGSATITATIIDDAFATCEVTVNKKKVYPQAVDLGLSVKWATFNVGAARSDEIGDMFAWGETKLKSDYSWSSYIYSNGDYDKLTKYCPENQTRYWNGSGSPDNKIKLDPEDDAARVNWGSPWRMPTIAEMCELINNCTWIWTENYNSTGVKGRIVTASNGNSIFLPAASSTNCYWSSSLFTDSPNCAYILVFYYSSVNFNNYSRCSGYPVRPVCDP